MVYDLSLPYSYYFTQKVNEILSEKIAILSNSTNLYIIVLLCTQYTLNILFPVT